MTGATKNIIDLFAGPGGWDEGLRLLGRSDVVGIEWDDNACQTAVAAGHSRVQADVSTIDPRDFGPVEGLIASPPCQAWSMAGKRGGEHDRQSCHDLADRMALLGDDSTDFIAWADPRSHLITQPIRWVRDLTPDWIALEEVPAVKDLWAHFAEIFRSWNYSVASGVLQAEAYGVPQTRKREILIASRVREVALPEPTHSKYYPRDKGRRDPGVLPWVSMAEALGQADDHPPMAENAGCVLRSNYGTGGDPAARGERTLDMPAPTMTGKAGRNKWVLRGPNQAHAAVRESTEPAPTILFGHARNDLAIYPHTAARPGQAMPAAERDRRARKLTQSEAAVLQTFPRAYDWQGTTTEQFQQIGNAIPPRLAAHVLRAAGAVDHLPDRADHPARQSVTPGRAA